MASGYIGKISHSGAQKVDAPQKGDTKTGTAKVTDKPNRDKGGS